MAVYRLPRPLDPVELRVVGCLLEKELSTPDGYPLSLKALTAAGNQRSNRDPVVELDAREVEEALSRMLPEMLVWRVRSPRVMRWQHNLESKWALDPAARAILAELLLRGPQTAGELRSRCSRMFQFDSLGDVESALSTLADPDHELVGELPPRPGQVGSRWEHRLGEPPSETTPALSPPTRPTSARGDVELARRVELLEERVDELTTDFERLRRELGAD